MGYRNSVRKLFKIDPLIAIVVYSDICKINVYCSVTNMDEMDKMILRILASGTYGSLRKAASQLGIPVSTLHDRIRRLRRSGVIKGTTMLIDEKKLGYNVKALILVNVDGKRILDVEREIAENPNVQLVLDITGEFDIAVVAVFKTIEELDRFVKNLLKNPAIKQTRTSIAFRTIKQEVNPPIT